MTIDNITSAFKTTGIYPFNPNAILDKFTSGSEILSPSNKQVSPLPNESTE